LKPQRRDLTPVLRRPVEPGVICDQVSGFCLPADVRFSPKAT
jgi:hypothetical protein